MGSGYRKMSNTSDESGTTCRACLYLLFLLGLALFSTICGCFGAFFYLNYIDNDTDVSSTSSSSSSSSNGGSGSSSSSSSTKGFTDTLIFEDNFTSLDLDKWEHVITMSGGGNWEFELYTNNRTNSYVRDGILYIKPTLTNNTYTDTDFLTSGTIDMYGSTPGDLCTSNADYGCFRTGTATNALNPVQSARLRSVKSFNFQYGKVEVRAQLPKGDWLWPAIWMLPKKNSYGEWPASGEIDIIEARGNYNLDCTGQDSADGDSIGINQMGSTLHWGPYYGADLYNMTHKTQELSNSNLFSSSFHTWTTEWSPSGFNFYLDNNTDPYLTVNSTQFGGYWKYGGFDTKYPDSLNPWNNTMGTGGGSMDAPFDQEFFLIMNLAVGGTAGFFPDGCTSNPGGTIPSYSKPWSDSSSTASTDFWNAHESWYPTWFPFVADGENAALKVDYIRVYEYSS